MPLPEYECSRCRRTYSPNIWIWRCECGGHLNFPLASDLRPEDVDTGEPSLWRYRQVLPLAAEEPGVYFSEGLTPLVVRRWADRQVLFKLDFLLPSGSFKDRGSAIMVNRLRELGIERVHEDSSGNGGASVAAYAAAAGMDCTIYVPASSSQGKLVQIAMHGARLVKVRGSRQEVAETAMAATGSFYASHNWHPLFIEGVKTVAFELWEQTGWSVPDVVVAPIGYGSTVLGLYRGFKELRNAGSVKRLPRIYAAQAANCASFHRAAQAGDPAAAMLDPEEVQPTIAEGVASQRPLRVAEVLTALAETGGTTVAVSEDEIVDALRDLARQGLYVEPTSAVAPAAARQILMSNRVAADETVVVVLTGSGLKATDKIGAILEHAGH